MYTLWEIMHRDKRQSFAVLLNDRMTNHFDYDDVAFERSFADGSLPPEVFDHEAHLRLAFIHIRKYGTDQAVENLLRQIKNFDEAHGGGKKFHFTVTVASIRMVDHFMRESSATNFSDFISRFPKLLSSFSQLLLSHYSEEKIQEEKAKNMFLPPDLLPFF